MWAPPFSVTFQPLPAFYEGFFYAIPFFIFPELMS